MGSGRSKRLLGLNQLLLLCVDIVLFGLLWAGKCLDLFFLILAFTALLYVKIFNVIVLFQHFRYKL